MPRAWVVEEFGRMEWKELPAVPPGPGEARLRVAAAGICGSDRHIIEGRDPRVPLPIIPGHEGVGEVLEPAGGLRDVLGREVRPGDLVAYDRGLTCGRCYHCRVLRTPFLCPQRRVYGINVSSAEPPHLRGNYAEEIILFAGTALYRLPRGAEAARYVSASCSGATAAHAVEEAAIVPGETVVVMGCGPLGVWVAALAGDAGARVAGVDVRPARLELAREFGVGLLLDASAGTAEERAEAVREFSGGLGADCVIDTTGVSATFAEGLAYLRRGGRYLNVGVAVPTESVPLDLYALNLRNLTLKGVWVSDTRHFVRAVRAVEEGRHPFQRLVTHRRPLAEAPEALRIMQEDPGALKVVLLP